MNVVDKIVYEILNRGKLKNTQQKSTENHYNDCFCCEEKYTRDEDFTSFRDFSEKYYYSEGLKEVW